jgi:two-component system, cell cycle response regulator
MDQNPSNPSARPPIRAGLAARDPVRRPANADLLGSSIFGPTEAPPVAVPARVEPKPAQALKLVVKGLKPIERQLLEGLVKVSQRRTPRLEILDSKQATDADVIMVDTHDALAMAWARRHPWIERRAVIWIDGTEAPTGHTLLRRPVQWPILPMVLARALESGPDTMAAVEVPAAGIPAPLPAAQPARAAQILVVDDSLAVRAHLRSLLEPKGFIVTDADCVEVALDTISRRAFDCVLMDVLMPETDGYEGCRQIKSRLRGAMAGCDAYLTKPVDPKHLGEVLVQQLRAMPGHRTDPAGPSAPQAAAAGSIPGRFATQRPA